MSVRGIITIIIHLCLSSCRQADGWIGPAVDFSHGKLRVSDNRRFLAHEDGTPFHYFGDTAWELFHRLDSRAAELYLEDRRAKGFTVIQAVILAELDGLTVPNRNGDIPLADNDPLQPCEAYFAWVDSVVNMAASKGMYVGLLPTWGDKVDKRWGTGPEIFDERNAEEYGRYLGRRYRDFPNIIWINGGDRQGGEGNFAVWDALGRGIKSGDPNHLMTYHPSGEASSSRWFHDCAWLDFNIFQSGHAQTDYDIYERLLVPDYNRLPVKPVMDAEPRYEDIPIKFKPKNGRFDDADVRNTLYWSLFGGAFGYTYGANDVWQFHSADREPMCGARNDWRKAMSLPGSSQIIHARRLLARFDYFSRIPAPEIIVTPQTDPADMAVATQGTGYAMVYCPNGNPVEISLAGTCGTTMVRMSWFDPVTGGTKRLGSVKAGDTYKALPPSNGRGNDWILIMENL